MANCSIFYLQILGSIFLSILFLQSGFDKVFNWKGEYDFQKAHFSKSIFKDMVFVNLLIITILEIVTGLLAVVSIGFLYFKADSHFLFYASGLSTGTLLMLFLGQRMAKDYAGSASLVGYLILSFFILYLSGLPNVCII